MLESVFDVYALCIVGKEHAPRHLCAKRSIRVRLPCLVVVAGVEETVGDAVKEFPLQILVIDRVDYAVRDDHAIPAALGDAVRCLAQGRGSV